MAVGRYARRRDRTERAIATFGQELASSALDVFELTEFAWHDCYGEITPPDDVIENMFLLSEGNIVKLISAARLAINDRRDLELAAAALRERN